MDSNVKEVKGVLDALKLCVVKNTRKLEAPVFRNKVYFPHIQLLLLLLLVIVID